MGRSEEETQRLIRQAQMFDLPLRRLFEDAGIEPGMRVLDMGSGAGDVALTAARVVGETGSVVGVDMNPAILETAKERARAAGFNNVTFIVGNLDADLDVDGEFDAVVGRFVLQYQADPAATLRSVVRYLRTGGIVAMSELNLASPAAQERAFPPSPLYERLVEWTRQGQATSGQDGMMGWRLYQTFLDAGLPAPQMRGHVAIIDGNHPYVAAIPKGALLSLRPVLLEHGLATEDELDLDAIAERLRAEFLANRTIATRSLNFDAWARKP